MIKHHPDAVRIELPRVWHRVSTLSTGLGIKAGGKCSQHQPSAALSGGGCAPDLTCSSITRPGAAPGPHCPSTASPGSLNTVFRAAHRNSRKPARLGYQAERSQQKVSNPPTWDATSAHDAATPEHVTVLFGAGRHAVRAFGMKRPGVWRGIKRGANSSLMVPLLHLKV